MRLVITLMALLVVSGNVSAGKLLDYIRDYDLNDYALGVAVSVSQSPYTDVKNSLFAYPYLTSFRDSAFTDDWLLIRQDSVGFRWISESQWEIGVLGRIETRGFGDSESDALIGVSDRRWTLEMGPTIGWRGWPVHFNFSSYAEVSDRHEGLNSRLSISYPMNWSRGYLVPSVELIHQNSDYTNYYYSVTDQEALPGRPAYSPGDAMNVALRARWGYALNEHWLLTGTVGLEFLDSEITDSPIVDRDQTLSGNLGLAYNVNVFRPRYYDGSAPRSSKFEFRLGAFQDQVNTKVKKDTEDGVPGSEIDLEDVLGSADEETVWQFDAIVRLGDYHRLEMGYFELGRSSETSLDSEIEFGGEILPVDTLVATQNDIQIWRAGYAYSLMRDAQKELGVMIGVHFANFDTEVVTTETGQTVKSSASTPLPVIGAHASIFLGGKSSLNAKVQIFRTDFDNYDGSLNYATLDFQHRVSESIRVGLGYNFYGMRLSSRDDRLNGYLEMRHHGPTAFVSIGF